ERRRLDAVQVQRQLVHVAPRRCVGRHLGAPWHAAVCARKGAGCPPRARLVLAPAPRGYPAMLGTPAPRRNSLRAPCALRSDSRRESEVRSALRARAGTPALLGCAQARPRRTAGAFDGDVVVLTVAPDRCRRLARPLLRTPHTLRLRQVLRIPRML